MEVLIELARLLTHGQVKNLEGPAIHMGGSSLAAGLSQLWVSEAVQLPKIVVSYLKLGHPIL